MAISQAVNLSTQGRDRNGARAVLVSRSVAQSGHRGGAEREQLAILGANRAKSMTECAES